MKILILKLILINSICINSLLLCLPTLHSYGQAVTALVWQPFLHIFSNTESILITSMTFTQNCSDFSNWSLSRAQIPVCHQAGWFGSYKQKIFYIHEPLLRLAEGVACMFNPGQRQHNLLNNAYSLMLCLPTQLQPLEI